MTKRQMRLLLGLATALSAGLIAASLASAKGRFTYVAIMSLGTGQLRIVTDADLEGFSALSDFTNGTREVIHPGSTYADSYELTRIAERGDATLFIVDQLRYIPPGSKEHGYIYYEGLINGSSEYDGLFFPTTVAGDEAMKRILSSSASTPARGFDPVAAAGLGLFILAVGFAAGSIYQQRRFAGAQSIAQTTRGSTNRAA